MPTEPTLDDVIARNMRTLREDRAWTQGELAEWLGYSRHRVMDLEGANKRRRPRFTWETLVALCDVLDCALWDLVLPAEGDTVDIRGVRDRRLEGWRKDSRRHQIDHVTRNDLARWLFTLDAEHLDQMGKYRLDQRRTLIKDMRQLLAELEESED